MHRLELSINDNVTIHDWYLVDIINNPQQYDQLKQQVRDALREQQAEKKQKAVSEKKQFDINSVNNSLLIAANSIINDQNNQKIINEIKNGKTKLLNNLVGQMIKSNKQADPAIVNQLLNYLIIK